jgi:hypothetical protein
VWIRDPIVWIGAAVAAISTAYALFAGDYLPYIDWSNHLGLIAVLAHGGETGALDYLTRSFGPSPYLLFYGVTALFAQLTSVPAAAKLSIVLSAWLMVPAAASLAVATGRSPRQALIAPLATFGVSMGWGFGSFVFAAPFSFFTLGSAERALFEEQPTAQRRALIHFAIWAALLYLAHGFLFITTGLMIAVRLAVFAAARGRKGARAALAPIGRLVLATLPVVLLAVPATWAQLAAPEIEAGSEQASGSAQIFSFEPWSSHLSQIGGHLLERGSPDHWTVMWLALALCAGYAGWSFARPLLGHPPREGCSTRGAEVYAALLCAMFLFGPMSVEWPSSIWFVYPRFGVLAMVALFLVPRPDLSGRAGAALALAAAMLVAWNAGINAGHIRRFSAWAQPYDAVRAEIPPRSRVLALTVVPAGDLTTMHPALGSLYFYHLADGASYTAFLFDKPSLPVHSRPDVPKPRAPFWRSPGAFDPQTHGRDFDYLVLRGAGLVARTEAAGTHRRVADHHGWVVFKTLEPTPRPGSQLQSSIRWIGTSAWAAIAGATVSSGERSRIAR